MIYWLFTDAGGHVCNAGNAKHVDTHVRATIASGTVLMPTASAPNARSMCISAGFHNSDQPVPRICRDEE